MPSLGSATIAALNRSGRFPTSSFTPRHTTILSHVHQVLGRAFRETGQLIDRLGIYMDSNTVDYDPDDDGREDGAVENVSEVQKYDMILSRHRTIFPLIGHGGRDGPAIAPTAFVAPCASIIGAVKVNDDASIWYGAIIRGDQYGNPKDRKAPKGKQGYSVTIGAGSNIQDGAVISANDAPTLIESDVTIGHRAQIHSATVCSNALIGMGAVVMQSAVIESNSYVAAGAVVESGTVVKGGELWVGNPARKLRDLTEKGIERLTYQANEYVKLSKDHFHVMELGGNITNTKLFEDLVTSGVIESNDPVFLEALPKGDEELDLHEQNHKKMASFVTLNQ